MRSSESVAPRFPSVAALFAVVLMVAPCVRFTAEAKAPTDKPRAVGLQAEGHLRVSGTRFINPDGSPFQWRGISAFRLLEFVAHGREAEATAYLEWAASKRLNVVRVLAMADGIFRLSAADGRRALPRLLEIARTHRMYVEVVALADTARATIDIPEHVTAIGAICARYPNAVLELANEPGHPTQAAAVHDPLYLRSLLPRVPAGVPTALGSVEYDDRFALGHYVTWHAPRTSDWPREIAKGAALVAKFKRPVINDEPMGAADATIAGRRDSRPARFRQAAAASRRAGLGSTFHYEGGTQARRLTRIELACLDAWLAGLSGGR